MSKKLAESLDRLVLDVKFGTGAFMKSREEAEALAAGLTAASDGVRTSFLLSPMDEPLGRTVGNALEVREAAETLQGHGPHDLTALTLDLATAVSDSPREALAKHLSDGSAWKKFLALVGAQGGDKRAFESWDTFHPAPVVAPLPCPRDGVVATMDAGTIGAAAVQLGAGRRKTTAAINPAVGFSGIRKIGERVAKGEPLLWIHAASDADADTAARSVRFEIGI